MQAGTIKRLLEKRFGFIKVDTKDLYFHHSAVQGARFEDLHEGQMVTFTEGRGPRGRPCAENVKPA